MSQTFPHFGQGARLAASHVRREPSVPLQGRQDARSPAAIRPGTRWWPTFPVSQPDQTQLPPRRSFEQHLGAVVGQARGITGQLPVPAVFTEKPGERLRTGIEDRHSKLAHPLRVVERDDFQSDSTGPTIRPAAPISIHRSWRFTAHPTLHLIAAHGRSLGELVSPVFPWTDGLPTSWVRAWLLPAVERGLTQERGGPREGVYTRRRPAVVFAGRPDRPFADAARSEALSLPPTTSHDSAPRASREPIRAFPRGCSNGARRPSAPVSPRQSSHRSRHRGNGASDKCSVSAGCRADAAPVAPRASIGAGATIGDGRPPAATGAAVLTRPAITARAALVAR